MNGRLAKKIRHVAEVNVEKTYVGLLRSLMNLPFKKRARFCWSILFKREYRAAGGKRK